MEPNIRSIYSRKNKEPGFDYLKRKKKEKKGVGRGINTNLDSDPTDVDEKSIFQSETS